MYTKIINVYYGTDALPYKDEARTVHYPITSSVILGASDTTKIRYYLSELADDNAIWLAVSKRANNTQGSQFLTKTTDEQGNRCWELSINGWYTEFKGDIYISLKCYQGGTTVSWNETLQNYEIDGMPIIQSTGSIKLACHYAPTGAYPNYQDEMVVFNSLVAQVGNKIDRENGIIVVSNIDEEVATNYDEGQLLYDVSKKSLYRVESGEFELFFRTYDKDYLDNEFTDIFSKLDTNPLPSFTVNIDDNVLDFINNNNLKNKAIVINDVYIGRFSYLTDTSYTFELESLFNSVRYYSTLSVDMSTKTFRDLFSREYEHNFELVENKSQIIDNSETKYPSNKAVNDAIATKQNILVNQQNIKSINGESLLGSGNIDISGGGNAEWGEITGTLSDQTDLNNELQDIREVAEGKTKSYVLSYAETISSVKTALQNDSSKKVYLYSSNYANYPLSNNLDKLVDITADVLNGDYDDVHIQNSLFNSNNSYIDIKSGISYPSVLKGYLILKYGTGSLVPVRDNYVFVQYGYSSNANTFARGETVYVIETDVPDRWGSGYYNLYKLETQKVDLTNYATKSEVALKSNLSNIAPEYDSTLTYTVGEVVTYNGSLVRCTTAITTPEEWNGSHWETISVASDFVNLTGTQVISGKKTFSDGIETTKVRALDGLNSISFGIDDAYEAFDVASSGTRFARTLFPKTGYNAIDLGTGSRLFRDLYLSGKISDGTNSVTVAEITKKPQSSYSLSDGGTITDNTLKSLIQNEQPIKLNGFTCYFSCDDGTNYQYVSTRYDSSANKNHINVITIDKSTWVATFHTSDIALS